MKPSDGLTYGFLLHQLLGYQTDAENRRYALKMENSTDNTNNGTNGKYYLEANWVSGYTAAQKARNLYVDLPQASDKDYGVVKTGDIINIVETVLLDGAW